MDTHPSLTGSACRFFLVDAFTDRPFTGNPAAVCLMPAAADPSWMQALARETNVSETAYLHPEEGGWRLRWFTPKTEVELCGHPTLATAHVLWEEEIIPKGSPVVFRSLSGDLVVTRSADWVELDLPALPIKEAPIPNGLLPALGLTSVRACGRAGDDYVLEVKSPAEIRSLRPDFEAILRLPLRSVIPTAENHDGSHDFVSRFFAPIAGRSEDHVTGFAHCLLGPYWQERLHRDHFVAHQASERGGTLHVTVRGDRVILGGRAVTIFRGELAIPFRPAG
ncbi:MAG: PhzF family phenazine biosynthesis protein [Actinobacteria bacterium]|nr:PhzF family phenazine biosynthesis protein [Actinomycetota bacterium]